MNEGSTWWHCKEPFSISKNAANQPQHWIRRVISMRNCGPGTPQRKQRRNNRRSNQQNHDDDHHERRHEPRQEPRQQHVMNPTWKSLLFSQHLADVAVNCQDEITLPAHKKILAAASPTLAQMLVQSKGSKRSASRSAKIVHWNVPYPAYVMRAVLSFIYVGPQDPLHRRLMQHEPWTLWNVAQTLSLVWLLHELDQAQAPRQAPGATAEIKSILRNHPRPSPLQNGGALENPSSLRQRRRTQSSTSSTISSSASSVSTATSATSLYEKRKYDLTRDKYLVAESEDVDDDDEGDYVSQRSGDHSSQSAESIVSRGSNSTKNDNDDDDDESSAAHPWLSSYLFLTAAQTNCCHPDNKDLNTSRDVPADYSSIPSQYEDEDASQDDEDDDDHIFDEEEDVDGDDNDDEGELEDEEPVGPLPPPLRTERQDSNMSDLTTSTDRRRVYQRIHHEKLRQDQRYYNPSPTSGCLNPIGLYTDAKPEQLLLMPPPMRNSSAPIRIESQSGLAPMVPTPAYNHILANHPPRSSKLRSSTTAAQLSFREKFQRKIRNRLLESERQSQPKVISPQTQPQPLSQLPGNKSNDCSPESSMNVDKIELLNVETGTSYQHHNDKAPQQQQHQVELLIRGPSMTFSTGTSLPVGRSASLLPLDYCARRDNRHNGEAHEWDHIESTFDSVPAVVSPLSAETTRKEKASTGIYLSPPRIHRLVTPTSTKSVRAVVHHYDYDLMKTSRHQQVADPTKLTITTTTDLGTGEGGGLVHLTEDHHRLQQASAAARSRMRDSSVDSRMAALVLSRMEDQQQQRQQSSSDHLLEDGYCDDLLINTEQDSGLSLKAPSSLSLTMREGSNVEVTISTKVCGSQDRQVLAAPNNTKISRQDMIQKLRRVVALYKKPVAENIDK